jgi:hypothetical protein
MHSVHYTNKHVDITVTTTSSTDTPLRPSRKMIPHKLRPIRGLLIQQLQRPLQRLSQIIPRILDEQMILQELRGHGRGKRRLELVRGDLRERRLFGGHLREDLNYLVRGVVPRRGEKALALEFACVLDGGFDEEAFSSQQG